MSPRVHLLAITLLLVACGGGPAYRSDYGNIAAVLADPPSPRGCDVTDQCGGLDYVDCGAAVDYPAYFVERSSGDILEVCGGACFGPSPGFCVACPPPEWTCE